MTAIGIDFGTTNSVIATWDKTGVRTVDIDNLPDKWEPYGFNGVFPSVMSKDESGRLLFGWDAKTSGTGRFEAVKRLFATQADHALNDVGEAIKVEEVATMLFAEMRKRIIASGVSDPDQAVVTVPANSRGLARHRTKLCAGMAGFEVLALINEPTAAAMAYAQSHPGAGRLLVFDWGGGTLDVTVLRSVDGVFIEETSSGVGRLGGLDFDTALWNVVAKKNPAVRDMSIEAKALFSLEIEWQKIRLSKLPAVEIEIPRGGSVEVTRAEFEEEYKGLLHASREPVESCLADLGIAPKSIDALVLVGGTCRIPGVQQFISGLLNKETDPSFNGMTAVGEGAAIAAAILRNELTTSDFFVSLEHALGTFVVNPAGEGMLFSEIIPKGHKLPATKSDVYFPVHPDQDFVDIQVVEGSPNRRDPDWTVLKNWEVQLPPRASEQSSRSFTLQYNYDVDGIVHVTAVDDETGAKFLEEQLAHGSASDKREMKKVSDRAKSAVEEGRVSEAATVELADPEAVRLVQLARTKVIPFLDKEEVDTIEPLVVALESSTGAAVDSARNALKKALAPYSFLF